MDFSAIMQMKNAWDTFTRNHPKFPMFLKAVMNKGIKEGTIIEITVTDPEGNPVNTNIKITKSDLALFETLKNMR